MNNLFNEEQIKKINEISKLPADKQQEELQKILPTFNEEQINFLKQQQTSSGNECFFCSLVEGKIESLKVFEDEEVLAVLDIRPVNPGQVLVIPKKHVQFSTELEDMGQVFNIANKISKKIFEVYGLDTNLFLANGEAAGQRVPHMMVNVIPRKEGDGVTFNFQGGEVDKKELADVRDKLFFTIEKPIEEEAEKETEVYKIKERIA